MTVTELEKLSYTNPIMLYDGVCNFCNRAVQFTLDKEADERMRFMTLQSDTGQEVLKRQKMATDDFSSVILLESGEYYFQTDVTVQSAKYLKSPWSYARYLKIIPAFLRNSVYNFIAKNRYKIMGKTDQCQIPSVEQRAQFLV